MYNFGLLSMIDTGDEVKKKTSLASKFAKDIVDYLRAGNKSSTVVHSLSG
jgi:hypothetical protein